MIFLLAMREVRFLAHHSLSLMRTAERIEQSKLGQKLCRLKAWEMSTSACLQGRSGMEKAELQMASPTSSMIPPSQTMTFNMAPPATKPGKSREGESRCQLSEEVILDTSLLKTVMMP